jgi:quercetin dioxygenase-like cupin family protein
MKAVEFVHSEDIAFRTVSSFASEEFLRLLSKDDREAQVKVHFQGSEDRLSLLEIKEIPNAKGALHAHEKDEIFYVVEGELLFGNRVCTAGDSISILAGTLYGFSAGPNGCRYLKFTGVADKSFIPADRYKQRSSNKTMEPTR